MNRLINDIYWTWYSLISVPDRAVIRTPTRRVPAATATIPDRLAHRRTRQAQVQVPTPTHHQVPTALQEGQGKRGVQSETPPAVLAGEREERGRSVPRENARGG